MGRQQKKEKGREIMAAYKDEKRGTWYVSFHYYDWTGKNKRKMKRGFKTKREAVEWEQHFLMKSGTNLDMTFEEFYKAYTRDRKPKLKRNTWEIKDHIVHTKLMPYFKDRRISEIRASDILQWQNIMISYHNKQGKAHKPTYLRTIQAELSAIFNHAVRFYDLRSNPVVKAGPLGSSKSDEMLFWTKEEYLAFANSIIERPVSYHAFQLLYWCGLRVGELLALTPGDFDFVTHTLHITKSLQRIHGEDIITDPKTRKSRRDIQMPEFLCDEIQSFLHSDTGYTRTERIFKISKGFLRREMDRGTEKAGVKRIRIHDLRHSHVSLLIHMGFSAVSIGNRVGHESQNITYHYAHMFPTEQAQMADMLNHAFHNEENNTY